MDDSWVMSVDRDDLADASIGALDPPVAGEGEAVLRIDRIGFTANNVTYAVLGETFRYWEFFPAAGERGVVPVWGFADVVDSAVDGVPVGGRYYGYFGSGTHLVVRPDRISAERFRDGSEHRSTLPSPYNNYVAAAHDPAYDEATEDLTVLYRPLFWTSFVFADWLTDTGLGDARRLLLSSASSKTAYGTAQALAGQGIEVVGLTSPGNRDFTASLGCYDAVVTYDELDTLDPAAPTVYADFAGDAALTGRIRDALGGSLRRAVVVGATRQDSGPLGTLDGGMGDRSGEGATDGFFAPVQMAKRIGDWGRDELERRFAEAWRSFAADAGGWVDVVEHRGPDGMLEAWAEVQSGRARPRDGHLWVG